MVLVIHELSCIDIVHDFLTILIVYLVVWADFVELILDFIRSITLLYF